MSIALAADLRSERGIRLPGGAPAVDPVAALLADAIAWWDASDYTSGQTLANKGTAGSVLDLQLGSTSGADSNDPSLLEWDGTNYLWLPGSNNNRIYLRSPKVAATYTVTYLDGSTASGAHTFDVYSRMFVQDAGSIASITVYDAEDEPIWTWVADEWESGDSMTQLPARMIGTPNLMTNPSFEGSDVYTWSAAAFNAPTSFAISSERAHTGTYSRKFVLPGNTNWEGAGIINDMRGFEPSTSHTVTAWVYRESGAGPIGMSLAPEGSSTVTVTATAPAGEWEQITVTANSSSDGGLSLSFHNTATGGAVTFFVDDIEIKQDTTARTAEVWREGSQPSTLVTAPTFRFVDDYLVVADAYPLDLGAGDSMTIITDVDYVPYYNLFGVTSDAVGGSPSGFFGGIDSHGSGAQIHVRLKDDSGNIVASSWYDDATFILGEKVVVGFVLDRDADMLVPFDNGVLHSAPASIASLGAITNTAPFYIGAYLGSGIYSTFRWRRTAIFDRVLDQDEIDLITQAWS